MQVQMNLHSFFKKTLKNFGILEINIKFAEIHGALAHLARAFDWQSRGDRFDPGMLH